MPEDLFSASAEAALAAQSPLAVRLRPRTLDEVVGQDHLLGPKAPLRRLIESDTLRSVILWGPPGTGKTTIAELIATHTKRAFERLSAVTAGVKDVREVIERAERRLGERGERTILFLDEVHRFNKAQQDALLPSVETGLLTLIGATTENPYFELNAPLRSRSSLFRLQPLDDAATRQLLDRGLDAEGATAEDAAVELLVDRATGDGRQVLTALEVCIALARGDEGLAGADRHVTIEHAEAALGATALRYGRDEHYDVVSAFIKSIRGSDPDAAVHYLARMLEAGEDARFIARRLVILASEDVGLADPMSLVVADAAARAVEFVGLPEAQLNLSQATIHLALAPKSNRAAVAVWNARADVAAGFAPEVPLHLRDGHPQQRRVEGRDYAYPHADRRGWVEQEHVAEPLPRPYYEPSEQGREPELARRLAERRRPSAGAPSE